MNVWVYRPYVNIGKISPVCVRLFPCFGMRRESKEVHCVDKRESNLDTSRRMKRLVLVLRPRNHAITTPRPKRESYSLHNLQLRLLPAAKLTHNKAAGLGQARGEAFVASS
jgi:hypothetical protein